MRCHFCDVTNQRVTSVLCDKDLVSHVQSKWDRNQKSSFRPLMVDHMGLNQKVFAVDLSSVRTNEKKVRVDLAEVPVIVFHCLVLPFGKELILVCIKTYYFHFFKHLKK